YNMYVKGKGGVLEKDYPYEASDGSCHDQGMKHDYEISDSQEITNADVETIKSLIYQYGAVGVTMNACGSFMGYTDGVYDSGECDGGGTNHIVALVGWDSTVKHKHGKGQGVWILRNSWDTSWGDQGYAKVAWDSLMIGESVTYVTLDGAAPPPPDPNPQPPPD